MSQTHENPTPEALIEALRQNHGEASGVRRLDQQLVYVPLGALAAAVYAIANKPESFSHVSRAIIEVAIAATAILVGLGLIRNHMRHIDILKRRDRILADLNLERVHIDGWFHAGRLIYGSLFLVGLITGTSALISFLPSSNVTFVDAPAATSLGLVLDVFGVILIFLFGLPEPLSRTGAIHLIAEQSDESERAKAMLYVWLSRFGLALVLIGFALQFAGNQLK